MIVLGIESSCDETAASVIRGGKVLSNVIASQAIHSEFGGVVPELASRAHHATITPTVQLALDEAGIRLDEVHAIAVSSGPGLIGSLLVGLSFAKGLSVSNNLPLLGINHIDAHMYANFIEHDEVYPFVALIVSGGHTRLVHVTAPFKHEVLGKTRDDAAGEAFDKTGKILGLPYPAGPQIDARSKNGNPEYHDFPRSMLDQGLEFSFSGLKTSVLYYTREKGEEFVARHLDDICASISAAITDVLITKLKRAVKMTGVKHIMIAGGVSANSMLRKKAGGFARDKNLELMIPSLEYCTDNAAMIAKTGELKLREGAEGDLDIKPFARLEPA